jgi:hypothetical protein
MQGIYPCRASAPASLYPHPSQPQFAWACAWLHISVYAPGHQGPRAEPARPLPLCLPPCADPPCADLDRQRAEAAALKARLESSAAAAGGDQKRALLQGAAAVRMLRHARSRRTHGPCMRLCRPLRSRAGAPLVSVPAPCADPPPPGPFFSPLRPPPRPLTLTFSNS